VAFHNGLNLPHGSLSLNITFSHLLYLNAEKRERKKEGKEGEKVGLQIKRDFFKAWDLFSF